MVGDQRLCDVCHYLGDILRCPRRPKRSRKSPPIARLLGRLREISRLERMRGGPGRIRIANQTVMSAPVPRIVSRSHRSPAQARNAAMLHLLEVEGQTRGKGSASFGERRNLPRDKSCCATLGHYKLYIRLAAASARVHPTRFPCLSVRWPRSTAHPDAYYNELRSSSVSGKDAPISRAIQHVGCIASEPVVGGLHHHYCRI